MRMYYKIHNIIEEHQIVRSHLDYHLVTHPNFQNPERVNHLHFLMRNQSYLSNLTYYLYYLSFHIYLLMYLVMGLHQLFSSFLIYKLIFHKLKILQYIQLKLYTMILILILYSICLHFYILLFRTQ